MSYIAKHCFEKSIKKIKEREENQKGEKIIKMKWHQMSPQNTEMRNLSRGGDREQDFLTN